MFLLQTEKDLLDTFLPNFRDKVELPRGVKFPLVVRDYFAWVEPSSMRVHLVFAEPGVGKPLGVVFKRDHSSGSIAAMCDWCHSYGSSQQIGMLTLDATPVRSLGFHTCLDLSCREKIATDTSLSPVAAQKRTRRVLEKMSLLVRRFLI